MSAPPEVIIRYDPALEIPPDYLADRFQRQRQRLINDTTLPDVFTEEEAAAQLREEWQEENDIRSADYKHQRAEEERVDNERVQREAEERHAQEHLEKTKKAEERAERLKKVQTIPPLNTSLRMDTTRRRFHPHVKAQAQLNKYLELDYFSARMTQEIESNPIPSSEASKITPYLNEDNQLVLQTHASRFKTKVRSDEELNWEEVRDCWFPFLESLEFGDYPHEVKEMFASFPAVVELHPQFRIEMGKEVFALYQAKARYEWYERVRIDGETPDIRIISPIILEQCWAQVRQRRRVVVTLS